MAKKKKKKRSSRSRSKQDFDFAVQKATAAALVLLIFLPMVILFPARIWMHANPQEWEQAQIVYADHVRHSTRSGSMYVMYDADGRQWSMPDRDAFDAEGFFSEAQTGDELTIRYYTWISGNIVQSIEGYHDYEVAAQQSRQMAKSENWAYAFVLAVSLTLAGYTLCQVNKVHPFFPRKGRT